MELQQIVNTVPALLSRQEFLQNNFQNEVEIAMWVSDSLFLIPIFKYLLTLAYLHAENKLI